MQSKRIGRYSQDVRILKTTLSLALAVGASHLQAKDAQPGGEKADPEKEIAALGGHLFRDPRSNKVVEVKLNESEKLSDADLVQVAGFIALTDLSLENTAVTGEGLAHLAKLTKLEWLNLWNTRVDDTGLAHLAGLRALQFLPVGRTRITDKGLAHLKDLPKLTYLGLRDTAVTDAGVAHLATLPALQELNLRGTRVGDECIPVLIR
ncbi:MAG: hypothetical protein GWO24_08590, partial [Akkermansiaceae bacterium]|nr:hypothetical protein [Akkermansiaceae bacterium]